MLTAKNYLRSGVLDVFSAVINPFDRKRRRSGIGWD